MVGRSHVGFAIESEWLVLALEQQTLGMKILHGSNASGLRYTIWELDLKTGEVSVPKV